MCYYYHLFLDKTPVFPREAFGKVSVEKLERISRF